MQDQSYIGAIVKLTSENLQSAHLFLYDEFGISKDEAYVIDSDVEENEVNLVKVQFDKDKRIKCQEICFLEAKDANLQDIFDNGEMQVFLNVLYEEVLNNNNTTFH